MIPSVMAIREPIPYRANAEAGADRCDAGDPWREAGKFTAGAMEALLGRITVVPDPEAMGAATLAIEAVVEKIEVKRGLFAALEAVMAPDAVLATNTSSLSVAAMT